MNKFKKIGIVLALSCTSLIGLSLINSTDEVKGNEKEGIIKIGDKIYNASDLFDEAIVYDETNYYYDNLLKLGILYSLIDKDSEVNKEDIERRTNEALELVQIKHLAKTTQGSC